ncbi:hypothetical protein [Dactylosporangium sp. NPDC050588]|uniref:hypothetical protein n=1 Tax=Dactylosporangium sp. NPDC050588 TaxID=3157211 RepID=UPI0033FCA0F2
MTFLSTPVHELRAQGRMSLLAEALAIRAWAEICLGTFDAASSAVEAMRLADETGQSLWAATARIAVALIDGVGRGWDTHHVLLAEAEHTALRTPNAASSLLAGVQLARGIAELGANRPEPAYRELLRVFQPADQAFQRVQQVWTIPAPGRPLFEAATANFDPHSPAKVATDNQTRGPLLLIASGKDHTVPESVTRATLRQYRHSEAVTDLVTFPDRAHSLTIDSGWREVADTCLTWLKQQSL